MKLSKQMKFFRFFAALAVLFAILTNFRFFIQYAGHFGGEMTYAVAEADRTVFRDLYGKEPVGYELNLKHSELLDRELFIEWHQNWKEKFAQHADQLKPGDPFYFLTQDPRSPSLNFLEAQGYGSTLVRSISFLDAPPLFFRLIRQFRTQVPKSADREIHVYRFTVPLNG